MAEIARHAIVLGDRPPDRPSMRVAYSQCGTGPPLLCLSGSGHPLVDRPAVFDSPLTESFTVIVPDQRGLGETESPPGTWSVADYAGDAAALLAALDITDTHVIGISFGGMVAQELAISHPEAVERLVLVSTSAGGGGGSSYPIHELVDLPARERFEFELALADTRRGDDWQRAHPAEVAALWARVTARPADTRPTTGESRQLDARRRHDCWDRLDQIAAATLVCVGRYDGVAPVANAVALCGRIPRARLEVFDAGHQLLRHDPRAWSTIGQFLGDATAPS